MLALIVTQYSSKPIIDVSLLILIELIVQVYYSILQPAILMSIRNLEYLLVLWPSFSTSAFLESIYQISIRYIEHEIEPALIFAMSFAKYLIFQGLYCLIVWRKLHKKRFS